MKIGDRVKIARDTLSDYGKMLGLTGTLIAGGSKHLNHRRYRFVPDNYPLDSIKVYEPDLEPLDEK